MNEVILQGNLGADPQTGTSGANVRWARVRLATNERYQEGNEWKTRSEWHNVVASGGTADRLSALRKGDSCLVKGKLRTREYTGDEGKKWITEVVAFLVYKVDARFEPPREERKQPQPAQGNGSPAQSSGKPEDDIPF